jgi:hypothetical protein
MRVVNVALVLDVDNDAEAFDAVNEMLRPHLKEYESRVLSGDTALADYTIVSFSEQA